MGHWVYWRPEYFFRKFGQFEIPLVKDYSLEKQTGLRFQEYLQYFFYIMKIITVNVLYNWHCRDLDL